MNRPFPAVVNHSSMLPYSSLSSDPSNLIMTSCSIFITGAIAYESYRRYTFPFVNQCTQSFFFFGRINVLSCWKIMLILYVPNLLWFGEIQISLPFPVV